MKSIVHELNGYLHSIRRLAKYDCDYWATHIKNENDIEKAIHKHFSKAHTPTKVIEIKQIDYDTVKKFFDKFIVQQLTLKTKLQC